MKKRIALWLCLLLALTAANACAESVPGLSDDLYAQAKEALSRLSYGEYDTISGLLSWSGEAPSAADWENFAAKFSTLNNGTVQREISVAFWQEDTWYVCVPVLEPKSDVTEVLVLASKDGSSFCGCAYATWGSIRSAYEARAMSPGTRSTSRACRSSSATINHNENCKGTVSKRLKGIIALGRFFFQRGLS